MPDTPVYDTIRAKRAVRQFEDRPLPQEAIARILNAGRLSGSAKNMQPWHFIAVTKRNTLQALSECGAYAGHLAGAALGIALVTPDPYFRLTVPFDLGRTTQNMMLTAWEMGIGSVMATIYRSNRAATILGVPADHAIPWCISFGYPAVELDRPARKGMRRADDEVVHYESW